MAAGGSSYPTDRDAVRAEFDDDFYLKSNPDVKAAGADPYQHFEMFGWREGRDPTPHFSVRKYQNLHPDVVATGANPFTHYILHGRAEGRALDHDYGARYDVLTAAPSFEERIATLAKAPVPPTDAPRKLLAALARASDASGLHLTISHDDYTAVAGGMQLCIRLESRAVQDQGLVHVHLFPARPGLTVQTGPQPLPVVVLVNGKRAGVFDAMAVAGAVNERFEDRKSYAIHSLIGHDTAAVEGLLAALNSRQSFYWLHDYASLCAGYALMRNDVQYCGGPELLSNACTICAYGQRRRIQLMDHVRLIERLAPAILSPSRMALDIWRARFPVAVAEARVHPHAVLVDEEAAEPTARTGPLRIAFLGLPALHKGWTVFADLVKRFGGDPRYSFHHLGRTPDLRLPGAAFTGVAPTAKKPEPMIDAIDRLEIDVALLWSLWPETFGFTAYEAAAGGAGIVTNPLAGHVAEFAAGGNGLVVQTEAALQDLFESGDIVKLMRGRERRSRRQLRYSNMTADFVGAVP